MTLLDVWVSGRPRTKGSLKGGRTGAGGVRLADTPLSKAWRAEICNTVVSLIADEVPEVPPDRKGHWRLRVGWPYAGPVIVRASFYFQRTRNDTDERPIARGYGDLDKLLRNVLDALKDSGVYRDDSQVVGAVAAKWFRDERGEGARIVVSPEAP